MGHVGVAGGEERVADADAQAAHAAARRPQERGPLVDPGEYNVAIAAAGKNETKTVGVEEDPRITLSAADRAKRRQALTKLYGMAREAETGRRKIVAIRTSLTTLTDSWKRPGAQQPPEPVKKAAEDLLARVKEVAGLFEVDRTTMERRPRASAETFRRLAREFLEAG